ncbi:MAG: phosphoribosylformylglycinamidine synthase I [Candidatus Eremiobacteraeota bacterium]|nr:phosphoribosylformylglycinamidine synthase I [Candidatus Eremiobacteraeota bacterium]
MARRIAVVVFPGTNSEEETVQLLRNCGGDANCVHWTDASTLVKFDAYVLPGGFAYEDRIRAGAIAAHDAMMDSVIDGVGAGKLVLGICNGAQILLEAGIVPGTGGLRRPTAAFTHNAPAAHFLCMRTHIKLAVDPRRSPITASLPEGAVIPAWVAHGEGRLAASNAQLEQISRDEAVAFVYARADGRSDAGAVPNGSALGAAALLNEEGNALAMMPHPERDGWTYNHPDLRGDDDMLAPSGGAVFFRSFVRAVSRQ